VAALVHPEKVQRSHVGVDLDAGNRAMTEKLLDVAKVGATGQQLSCNRVSEHVQGDHKAQLLGTLVIGEPESLTDRSEASNGRASAR
jgi:hypothetical protein